MTETLRIDVEDWSLDLVPEIERSFGIAIPDAEWHRIVTMADLHSAVLHQSGPTRGDVCGTARTFFMLRRALTRHGAAPRIGTEWRLTDQGLSPKKLRALLQRETGLRLPVLGLGWSAGLGCLAAVTLAGAGIWFNAAWMLLPTMALGGISFRFDPGSWAGEWATLGTLARSAAASNHALLVEQGAIHSPATVWHSLVNLLAPYGGAVSEMQPTTRLLA